MSLSQEELQKIKNEEVRTLLIKYNEILEECIQNNKEDTTVKSKDLALLLVYIKEINGELEKVYDYCEEERKEKKKMKTFLIEQKQEYKELGLYINRTTKRITNKMDKIIEKGEKNG